MFAALASELVRLNRRLAHRINLLGLILTSRRPSPSASAADSHAFQCQNRFFDLLAFGTQLAIIFVMSISGVYGKWTVVCFPFPERSDRTLAALSTGKTP